MESIDELVRLGKVQRVTLELIKRSQEFKPDDNTHDLIEAITENYYHYLSLLNQLDGFKDSYLITLKEEEIKFNQSLEKIDPFLIAVYINSKKVGALDYSIKLKKDHIKFSSKTLCRIHQLLINGTKDCGYETSCYRTENNQFVGHHENGGVNISYIPIDYRDINEAVFDILEFINISNISQEELFTNPLLIHGNVAALQLFSDGNTRLSRILYHLQLWHLTNELDSNISLNYPALYISEAIQKNNLRDIYRSKIKEIALNPSNQTLNHWITFNLEILEHQIYYNIDKIETISRKLHK